jgi:citrate synthase
MMTFETSIASCDEQSITVRGLDLTEDIIDDFDFGEFFYFHFTGERPSPGESRLFNAALVTAVEHGFTPSVIAARLTYTCAPEALQGAVASGLLGAGRNLLGSMENAAEILQTGVARVEKGENMENVAVDIVASHDRLPGYGHPLHEPTDPRAEVLLEMLDEEGYAGQYVDMLLAIQTAGEEAYETSLLVNATGALAALISELGLPPMAGRGLVLVSRAAGLVGHLHEEMQHPTAFDIWELVEDEAQYRGE